MRILWLCNVPIPQACKEFGTSCTPYGGWLIKAYEELSKFEEAEIFFAYPDSTDKVEVKGRFIRFPRFNDVSSISLKDKDNVKKVLNYIKPDILHIFGTEMSHALAFAKEFNKPDCTIVSIQGVMRDIAEKYCFGIPKHEIRVPTIAELILRSGTIQSQKKVMLKRSENEYELMNSISYVVGRTKYDRSFVQSIDRHIKYINCPESLREEFYTDSTWKYDKCKKNTVFMSQASYPIKGIHFLIPALGAVKKVYPSFKLYVGGDSLLPNSYRGYVIKSSYQRYVRRLIQKYQLDRNIIFLGSLNANQMKEQYLNANVYVLSSTVENSPNSLGEAMILGTPVIASNVGGVSDILCGDKESMYEFSDVSCLADKIIRVFKNKELLENNKEFRISSAKKFFNADENIIVLRQLYSEIAKQCMKVIL